MSKTYQVSDYICKPLQNVCSDKLGIAMSKASCKQQEKRGRGFQNSDIKIIRMILLGAMNWVQT